MEYAAFVAGDAHRTDIFVAADDPLQHFGIHAVGQFSEAHYVAEQHGELAAFA